MIKIRKDTAGIDIGAKKVFVFVEGQKVKNFYTFTEDFEGLVLYLLKHKIQTVAMEATGVYWTILYDILEEAGTDLSRWPTEKHFTSWLGVAPGQHHSGKMKRTKRKQENSKAG